MEAPGNWGWLETALFTAMAVNPHFPCLRGRLETPVAEPLAESYTSGIPAIRGNAHPTGRRGDHQVRWYMSFLYLHHFLQPAASKTGLRANPHDDSEALTDSEQHSQFTEAQANISREVGSSLTAYPMKDGYQAITRRKLFYWKIFPVGHARSLSRREFRNRVTTRLIKDGKSTIGPR